MAQINPNFVQKVYELTAFAYSAGIDCPAINALNSWVMEQRAGMATATTTTSATTTGASFDDALLAAVRSSPYGIGLDDLRAVLAQYRRPPNQIGAALARLAKRSKVRKSADGLWHIMAGGKSAANIDKSLVQARSTRKAATTTKAISGSAGGETQPLAAATG